MVMVSQSLHPGPLRYLDICWYEGDKYFIKSIPYRGECPLRVGDTYTAHIPPRQSDPAPARDVQLIIDDVSPADGIGLTGSGTAHARLREDASANG